MSDTVFSEMDQRAAIEISPELREFQRRFDGLPKRDRQDALAEQYVDYGDVIYDTAEIAKERLLNDVERDELEEAARFARAVNNGDWLRVYHTIEKAQRKLELAAMQAQQKPNPPQTVREFEKGLKDMGFTSRAAERIAAHGFKE